MVVVDKGMRSKAAAAEERVDEEDSNHIDEKLVLSIEKLQEIQDELEKVNEEASDKVLEVEQKYNEIRRPVYLKRNQIIQTIPDFWLTAFLSHPALVDLLTDEDQKIFKYLVSIDVEDFKDVKSGYCISFTFSPNPYFEDAKLTKAFSFTDEGTNINGTTIKWKEGMELANGDAHEKKGTKRPFAAESFFSWFGETQPKNMSEVISDEVADIIKEDLWPNPLKYFNNEVDEEDDFDGDDDDDEVLRNNTFVSATNRVAWQGEKGIGIPMHSSSMPTERSGSSPLPRFASEVGVAPKHRGFWYKDYLQLRMKNASVSREEIFRHIPLCYPKC